MATGVEGMEWRMVPAACADGCMLAQARQMLATAQKLVGRTANGEIVSQALWCDQGGHAFSARDPKSEHWERQVTDPKTHEKTTIPWDVCGEHMAQIDNRLAQMEAEQAARSASQLPANSQYNVPPSRYEAPPPEDYPRG